MENLEIINRFTRIIDYAAKVKQYPKSSAGYDPVDRINLIDSMNKLNKMLQPLGINISETEIIFPEHADWTPTALNTATYPKVC